MDVLAAVLCIVVIVTLIRVQRNMVCKMAIIDADLFAFQKALQKTKVEQVDKPLPQVQIFTSDLKILE